MPTQIINLNNSTPAAPAGTLNVEWQADAPSLDSTIARNVSAYVPKFTGDTGAGGSMGVVPAPAAGDAAAGKVLKADGTWYVPPSTPIATTSAPGIVQPDGTTITIDDGVISAVGGGSGGGMTNPMTTEGDLIVGGASGAPTRLAPGTSGQVLQSNGSTASPSWVAPSGGSGGSGGIAPTVVQSAQASNSGSPVNVTFPSTPTPGNLLLFIVGGWANNVTPPDGVSLFSAVMVTNEEIGVYLKPVVSGDGQSWSFTPSGDVLNVFAVEIENAGYVSALAVSLGQPSNTGATSFAPLAQSFSGGPALVFAGFEADGATSAAAQTDFTLLTFLGQGTSHPIVVIQGANLAAGTRSMPGITWTGVTLGQQIVAATVVVNAIS